MVKHIDVLVMGHTWKACTKTSVRVGLWNRDTEHRRGTESMDGEKKEEANEFFLWNLVVVVEMRRYWIEKEKRTRQRSKNNPTLNLKTSEDAERARS